MTMKLVREVKNQSQTDLNVFERTALYWEESADSTFDKIETFAKYVPRQTLAKFLVRYEIFQKILNINGSIVEAGVLRGGGLFTFAKLSAILEPINHTRKIIGFDTFGGFPSIHEKDKTGTSSEMKVGGLDPEIDTYSDLIKGAEIFDMNRPISHIPKIELVKGDITQTMPRYIEENPHLVVSLLYLDVDLYEPTKVALELLVPRMPKGSIIVFDQLNAKIFPGETLAVDEVIGLRNLRIERFPMDSYVSYAVLE
jgi:hypothetical protein